MKDGIEDITARGWNPILVSRQELCSQQSAATVSWFRFVAARCKLMRTGARKWVKRQISKPPGMHGRVAWRHFYPSDGPGWVARLFRKKEVPCTMANNGKALGKRSLRMSACDYV